MTAISLGITLGFSPAGKLLAAALQSTGQWAAGIISACLRLIIPARQLLIGPRRKVWGKDSAEIATASDSSIGNPIFDKNRILPSTSDELSTARLSLNSWPLLDLCMCYESEPLTSPRLHPSLLLRLRSCSRH